MTGKARSEVVAAAAARKTAAADVPTRGTEVEVAAAARKTAAVADLSTLSGTVHGVQSKKASKQRHDSLVSPVSTGASTIKPIKHKEPTLARSQRLANIAVPGPYPQADLQAAREMHDKATKASERKRGRSDKQQTRLSHARDGDW